MPDILLVLTREQIGEDMIGRNCANGQRCHELLRCSRHQRAHMRATFTQTADEVRRLIGGNAATDNEKNALPGQRRTRAGRHCNSLRSYILPGQQNARFLFHGAPVLRCPDTQPFLGVIIEITDGNAGHLIAPACYKCNH